MPYRPSNPAAFDAELSPQPGPDTDIMVDMPGGDRVERDGDAAVTYLEGGDIVVDLDGEGATEEGKPSMAEAMEHGFNLAEILTENELAVIATEVLDGVDQDLQSRNPWFQMVAKGLKKLGVEVNDADANLGVFKIAKQATFPIINEALVQFQARAIAELFPPGGPVKAMVLGDQTEELVQQSERVEGYMNYQLTFDDKTYFPETDQMMFLLGIEGSIFRKAYKDPLKRKNVLRMVRAENFVVPYHATSLEDAPRFTHRLRMMHNDMLKLMNCGYFRHADIPAPASTPMDRTAGEADLSESRDKAEGKTDPGTGQTFTGDIPHDIEECYLDLDIKGFEDVDPTGEATGIKLPYCVHVERESKKVLAVYRNWKEDDQDKRKIILFAHYRYLPGTGFYGWGLFHAIGGLDSAATAILRTLIVSAAFAGAGGGFKTKEGRGVGSSITLEPGVYKDTDATFDEVSRAFYTPEFKQPPEALFRILGILDEKGMRFASTTEAMVGDAKNTGPVGTTLALIEQGSKVHSGIHKRCHAAAGDEFRMLADLNGETIPLEGYPYNVPGASRQVFGKDFDARIDIMPVSDPNIFSSTQRIAIAQAGLELANSAPDLHDRREAFRRMHEALRQPDIDKLMPPIADIERCDPVTENALALTGHPVKVYPDQPHDAHIAVHLGELQIMALQKSPSLQTFQQVILPHIAEHEAQALRIKFMQQSGIDILPPLNLDGKPGEPAAQQLPPEIENQIAVKAAEMMSQLLKQLQDAQQKTEAGGQSGDAAGGQAEGEQAAQAHQQGMEQDDAATGADIRRKDAAAAAGEKRKDFQLQADLDRKDAAAGLDPASVKAAQSYLMQRGLDGVITPRALAVSSRALGHSFDEVVRMVMLLRSGGQGMGASARVGPHIAGDRMFG